MEYNRRNKFTMECTCMYKNNQVWEPEWKDSVSYYGTPRQLIENYFPDHKYLNLFARIERENWICWGSEI